MKKLSVSLTEREASLGWVYLCLYMFVLPRVLSSLNMLLPVHLPEAQLNFAYFLINLICVVLIGRRFLWESLLLSIRSPFRTLRTAFLGVGIYYCASLLLALVTTALRPDFVNLNDRSIISMSRDSYTLMAVGLVLLAPPVEEFLYRGLIFGQLYPRNRFAAYTVSTLFFAAIHISGYIGSYDAGLLALCFLQYIPAGLCLAWAYRKADSIWAPILMHITVNQISMQITR